MATVLHGDYKSNIFSVVIHHHHRHWLLHCYFKHIKAASFNWCCRPALDGSALSLSALFSSPSLALAKPLAPISAHRLPPIIIIREQTQQIGEFEEPFLLFFLNGIAVVHQKLPLLLMLSSTTTASGSAVFEVFSVFCYLFFRHFLFLFILFHQ